MFYAVLHHTQPQEQLHAMWIFNDNALIKILLNMHKYNALTFLSISTVHLETDFIN